MKKILPKFIPILLLLLSLNSAFSRPLSDYDVEVTRDLSGEYRSNRADYLLKFPEREQSIDLVEHFGPNRDEEGTVVVAVNTTLYNQLEEDFNTWIEGIAEEGYDMVLTVTDGGTAQELKDLVMEEGGEEIVGAIFAGNLPLAWFEHHEYFRQEHEPDNQRLHDYPIDLFFTDLDGAWEDTTGNEIYDFHHGEVDPDIWFGRLPAHNLSRMDEYEVIEAYLDKVQRYRAGELMLPHRALNYIDDDWCLMDQVWSRYIRHAYGYVIAEADSNTTSAGDYIEHLVGEGLEMVQVAVHSTSDSHSFFIENRTSRDYFRFWDLRDDVNENVMFYNLFACSIMDFSERHNLCMGVLYALGGEFGLGAVGSLKTGGMLFFDDYYRPLAEGQNFGQALQNWMIVHAHDEERPNWARSWFYGMTYYGDPTLKIKQGLRVGELVISELEGDDDGVLDVGEAVSLTVPVNNRSEDNIEGITITIDTADPLVEILNGEGNLGDIAAGETGEVRGLGFRFGEDASDGHLLVLDVEMTPEEGEAWWDMIEIPVRAPRLEAFGIGWDEVEGDDNGWIDPGETGVMSIHFRNDGGDDMHSQGLISVNSLDGMLITEQDTTLLQPVASETTGNTDNLEYSISEEARDGSAVFIEVTANINDIERGSGIIALPVGAEFSLEDDLAESPVWFRTYAISEGLSDFWRYSETEGDSSGCLAFGGPDSLEYEPRCDAAVELPLMMFGEDAVLQIRHRMDIETMYDAATVEVDRGEGWSRVVPEDGYNGLSVEIGDYLGGDCWNGTFDWTESSVPLGGPAGPLRIRFRFSSDAGVEGNGWFIDQIAVTGTPLEETTSPELPIEFNLFSAYPNPFNSTTLITYALPTSGFTRLTVFDIHGREMSVLHEGDLNAGKYTSELNAQEWSSGIYFIKLQTDVRVGAVKVICVK